MAFINGSFVIDAPASALNNSGESIQGARTDNTVAVKHISTPQGRYPYVSGQALRYWLRQTLESSADIEWESAPIYRGNKVSFSDANPIIYWDDDLLGYMRAPAKKDHEDIIARLKELGMTPQEEDKKGNPQAITRVSPFRVGTLVSLAPSGITEDFGTMSRHEGDPVPYEHQFYRALLHTLFSLDLRLAGRFYYLHRTGFRNLDEVRTLIAKERNLTQDENDHSFQLSNAERANRIKSLLVGLGRLQGGAKQAVHYTDVSPAAAIFAVVRGGSNPFNYIFRYDIKSKSVIFDSDALQQNIKSLINSNRLLSPVYIGWKPGFMVDDRINVEAMQIEGARLLVDTPENAFAALANDILQDPTILDE